MRNLLFTSQRKLSLPLSTGDGVDSSRRSYCFGRQEEIFILDQINKDVDSSGLITSKLNAISVDGDNVERREDSVLNGFPSSWVTQVELNAETENLYFATEDGWFLMYDRSQELNDLFRSEEGIAAFSVSPDARYVAVVTGRRCVLLMSIPYIECVAQHKDHQTSEQSEETSPAPPPAAHKDVGIAWRSDSKYFAVNLISASNKRCIAVYDEAGLFVSRTEDSVTLLNACLTWQPSGGLLAAFGYSPTSKNAVFLFEKNGLQRAEFSIDQQNDKKENVVERLEWNLDSTILAVTYANRVELWTRSNYVWMLKRTVKYFNPEGGDIPVRKANWDFQRTSRLHVIYDVNHQDAYAQYDVNFTYTACSSGPALALWWNARSLFFTPFRDFCAPPPNGFGQFSLANNVCSVVTSPSSSSFCVVDCLSNFSVYNYLSKGEITLSGVLKPVGFVVDPTSEWLWVSSSILLSITPGSRSLSVHTLNPTQLTVTLTGEINLKTFAANQALSKSPEFQRIFLVPGVTSSIIAELSEGSLVLIQLPSDETIDNPSSTTTLTQPVLDSVDIQSLCKFPHKFTSLEVMRLENTLENNLSFLLLAHDVPSKNLYIHWNLDSYFNNSPFKLSFDCTSFTVFDNHLLFTTTSSLHIYKRESLVSILERSAAGNDDVVSTDTEKYTRKIEKGSTIVTCCVNRMLEPSLVLQIIPRGNLEIIFPRPLLITSFSKSLRRVEDEHRYSKIMTAIRRHRVDYRVLVDQMRALADEQTSLFSLEQSLGLMINQVQDAHSLVLLVTDLNEEYFDCIRMIKDILEKIIFETSGGCDRKRNLEEAYLASLAKLGLLEEALNSHLIKGEQEKDRRQFVTERVKFLSYYCDNPDILFDTAIGTYDLTLASLVADCLGKDPKEYIPILDGFQSLAEHARKFKIDERLRRYSKAIIHLINDDSVQMDEVLRYMERHRLFTDSAEYISKILRSSEEVNRAKDQLEVLLKESKVLYGKYLEEHNRLKEASLMYRQGGQLLKAIDCAVKNGSWETALEIFYSSEGDQVALNSLSNRLILQLEELKNYGAAAVVAEEYLQDPSRTVELHIRNRKWRSARLCAQRNQQLREIKCVEEVIRPKLEEFAQEHLQMLESLRTELKAKRDRLKVAKALKQKRLDEGVGDFDSFSDVSSISTTSSIRSGSTGSNSSGKTQRSKNKRKMERKLQSMKEGSAFEDLAITSFLWNSIEKVEREVKSETSELVESLWTFELTSLARSLGTEMDSLVYEINSIVKDAWEVVLTDELLEVKCRVPPPSWTSSWEKLCLHESSSKATSSSSKHHAS